MLDAKKAQSWSIDIALAVVIFIAAFFILYIMISPGQNSKVSSLKEEASIVSRQVASEKTNVSIIENNELSESRLNELKALGYDELKRRLRTEDDFCIYFEDENGNVILIDDTSRGIGTPNINVSGVPCSKN